MKVHLVDGHFELFRCYYAAPSAEAADGKEVGACRGLLQTLTALLRQDDVTHIAVAFDEVAPPSKVRGAGDPVLDQTALAMDVVRGLGILLWPMIRYQADDALATGAARFRDSPGVEQVVICSTDKDFAQCVRGTKVVTLDRIRKVVHDEDSVREKFGVPPQVIPELFALMGDPSDGIPGIPGWGARSSAAVLSRYPTIEEIPEDPDDWDLKVRGKQRLSDSLRERYREALLYRNLSIRSTEVPLPDDLEHLEWKGANREALEKLTDTIGEKAVLERIPRWRE